MVSPEDLRQQILGDEKKVVGHGEELLKKGVQNADGTTGVFGAEKSSQKDVTLPANEDGERNTEQSRTPVKGQQAVAIDKELGPEEQESQEYKKQAIEASKVKEKEFKDDLEKVQEGRAKGEEEKTPEELEKEEKEKKLEEFEKGRKLFEERKAKEAAKEAKAAESNLENKIDFNMGTTQNDVDAQRKDLLDAQKNIGVGDLKPDATPVNKAGPVPGIDR